MKVMRTTVATVVAATLSMSAFSVFAEASLTGAGATFPAPVYAKWADTYQKETGNKVNYQGIGSSGGVKQIIANTVDFGASDAPLSDEKLAQEGLFQFPTVIGGVVLAVNLPGLKSGELVLDGKTLGDIYLGKIKKWDDEAIVKLNVAVHHAEVVRNDGLGGGVGSFSIAAVGAGIHLHKAVMGQLGPDGILHVVTLQRGIFLLECAVAEPAVFAAGGDDAVILAVRLLNGLCFRQFLEKIVRAIVEPIDVLQVAVVRLGHVGVDAAAGFTHGFGPVISRVIGVLSRYAVQNGTLAGTIYKGAVRVFHIPAHGRLAIPGIFRGAEHDKGSLLLADFAVKGFVGHGGVGVQFVGAVVGLLPVLSGVVVTVLLGGKGAGHHTHAQHQGQQQGCHAFQAMPGCLAFQVVFPPFV